MAISVQGSPCWAVSPALQTPRYPPEAERQQCFDRSVWPTAVEHLGVSTIEERGVVPTCELHSAPILKVFKFLGIPLFWLVDPQVKQPIGVVHFKTAQLCQKAVAFTNEKNYVASLNGAVAVWIQNDL